MGWKRFLVCCCVHKIQHVIKEKQKICRVLIQLVGTRRYAGVQSFKPQLPHLFNLRDEFITITLFGNKKHPNMKQELILYPTNRKL